MIIGSAGSGKSTAARMLGQHYDLPVYHIDREVFWLPGWVERDKDDQVRQVARIVAQQDWVFEGNNSRTFHLRAARAEMLIWLDIPVWLRVLRAIRRTITTLGQPRPDMADGCVEKLSMLPGFLHFIVTTNVASRRKQAALFQRFTRPKHKFRRSRDFNAFVAGLEP